MSKLTAVFEEFVGSCPSGFPPGTVVPTPLEAKWLFTTGLRFKSGSADQHVAILVMAGKLKQSRYLYVNHPQIGKASRLAPEVATWV